MPALPPGLRLIAHYRRAWLLRDVVAGVVLTTLLVPQGMAYAELAGLPAVTPVAPWRDQLTSALVGLGWSGKEAETALAQLAPVADAQIVETGSVEVAVLLRQALQLLGWS